MEPPFNSIYAPVGTPFQFHLHTSWNHISIHSWDQLKTGWVHQLVYRWYQGGKCTWFLLVIKLKFLISWFMTEMMAETTLLPAGWWPEWKLEPLWIQMVYNRNQLIKLAWNQQAWPAWIQLVNPAEIFDWVVEMRSSYPQFSRSDNHLLMSLLKQKEIRRMGEQEKA